MSTECPGLCRLRTATTRPRCSLSTRPSIRPSTRPSIRRNTHPSTRPHLVGIRSLSWCRGVVLLSKESSSSPSPSPSPSHSRSHIVLCPPARSRIRVRRHAWVRAARIHAGHAGMGAPGATARHGAAVRRTSPHAGCSVHAPAAASQAHPAARRSAHAVQLGNECDHRQGHPVDAEALGRRGRYHRSETWRAR